MLRQSNSFKSGTDGTDGLKVRSESFYDRARKKFGSFRMSKRRRRSDDKQLVCIDSLGQLPLSCVFLSI
jgi:hypothetical protein